jgi:hypothetical protein
LVRKDIIVFAKDLLRAFSLPTKCVTLIRFHSVIKFILSAGHYQ